MSEFIALPRKKKKTTPIFLNITSYSPVANCEAARVVVPVRWETEVEKIDSKKKAFTKPALAAITKQDSSTGKAFCTGHLGVTGRAGGAAIAPVIFN